MKVNIDLLKNLIEQNNSNKIAIAVSGGRDSLALVDIINKARAELSVDILCVIVNHNLRPESLSEAKKVQDLLHSFDMKTEVLEWQHDEINSDIHNKARTARYKLIADYCKKNDVKIALTAHHANDQLETLLMRIFRGTGVKGIMGIRPQIKAEGVYFVRPLLNCTRKEITDYCIKNNLEYIDDPSNENTRFTRTKIRQLLNHMNEHFQEDEVESFIHHSNLFASQVQTHWRAYREFVITSYKRYAKYHSDFNYIEISDEVFAHHSDLAVQIFIESLEKVSKKKDVDQAAVNEMARNLKNGVNNTFTLHGCIILKKGGNILVFAEQIRKAIPIGAGIKHGRYNIINHDKDTLMLKSLGNEGWKALKEKGIVKPNLPDSRILFNQIAVFDETGRVIACPALRFNERRKHRLSITKFTIKAP